MTDDQHGPDARASFDPDRAAALRRVLSETAAGEPARTARRRRRRVVAASVVTAVVAVVTVGGLAIGLGATPPGGDGQAGPELRPTGRPSASSSSTPGSLEPVGTPTATAEPAPSPTASPTPTRPAYDPADPSTWTIASDSIGPAYLDAVESEQVGTISAFDRRPDDVDVECPATFFSRPDGLGLVTGSDGVTDATTYVVLSGDQQLGAAALAAVSPTTVEGIGLGSDTASVLAAYPQARKTMDDPAVYGVQYAVEDGQGRYVVFELHEGGFVDTVTVSRSDRTPYEFCG